MPSLAPDDKIVTLPPEESRHLARVLRLRSGDAIRVFDGRGHEFVARVVETGGSSVKVRLVERVETASESPLHLTVAQAVLTGDKMDAVVRDLTMLGVAAVQPVVSARTEVRLATVRRSRRVERWRRVAVASAKQCGRVVVPQIGEARELRDWLAEDTSGVRLILVEPAGDVRAGDLGPLNAAGNRPRSSVALLVGPEGGWTREEATAAVSAGFVPWTLGGRTLRADAAPLVAASILQYLWGDLS